ncbi:M48 family metallopeptidase [Primorskyibacter sp. S187A]|uniref:M48 family metallopeptidase n=1 Tax=Primorskyibacter sp. S187A TaxID=3415130 RepID=UPI003C7E80A1
MRVWIIVAALALAGCSVEVQEERPTRPHPQEKRVANSPSASERASIRARADRAANQFVSVIQRMEPIAEQMCREERPGNCDFQIVVDNRVGLPPNAFQTVDRRGRPVLAFNLALITSVRNADELAFVVGHEAAHHIANHLERRQQSATVGAAVFGGVIGAITGGDAGAVRAGQEIGAAVGSRSYSKEFELEADALGTVITHRAGYDPVRGSQFFTQLPDPGNAFLGTHPPNAARKAIVARVASELN